MIDRCENPKSDSYPRYGALGISVWTAWNDFTLFLFDMGEPIPGQTLRRRDSSVGFTPENCFWGFRNKTLRTIGYANFDGLVLTHSDGRENTVSQWSARLRLKPGALMLRLAEGWPLDDALTLPKNSRRPGSKTVKHGLANDPIYGVWANMLRRCYVPSELSFSNYGARGIQVCKRWLDVASFIRDMSPRPDGTLLERKDNDGDYCPENCIWATLAVQARNKRNSRILRRSDGVEMNLCDWAAATGKSHSLIWKRVHVLGWSVDDALSKPVAKCVRKTKG